MDEQLTGGDFEVSPAPDWIHQDIRQNPTTRDFFRVMIDTNGVGHYERIASLQSEGSGTSTATTSSGSYLTLIGGEPVWAGGASTQINTIYDPWQYQIHDQLRSSGMSAVEEFQTKKKQPKSFLELITLTKENDKTKEGNS